MSLSKTSKNNQPRHYWGALAAAIAGVVFLTFVVSTGLIYGNSPAYECEAQSEQHGAQPEGLSFRAERRESYRLDYNPQQQKERETCAWGHNAEQWLALLTLWLVAGTVLLAGFTAFLWLDASDAARKQRNADRIAHQRELRAYVSVTGNTVLEPGGAMVRAEIENSGLTPALDCSVRTACMTFNPDIPKDFGYFDVYGDYPIEPREFVLGPRQNTHLEILLINLQANQRLAARVQGRLYFWGWIDYSDIFGERHRTEFCFEIRGHAVNAGTGVSYSVDCRHGPRHNTVDQQCLREPLPPLKRRGENP